MVRRAGRMGPLGRPEKMLPLCEQKLGTVPDALSRLVLSISQLEVRAHSCFP